MSIIDTSAIMERMQEKERFEQLVNEIKGYDSDKLKETIISKIIMFQKLFERVFDRGAIDEEQMQDNLSKMLVMCYKAGMGSDLSDIKKKMIEETLNFFGWYDEDDIETLCEPMSKDEQEFVQMEIINCLTSIENDVLYYEVYTYMLAIACIGVINEEAISGIRNIWKKVYGNVNAPVIIGNMDYRCMLKFKNEKVMKSVLPKLHMEASDGEDYTFEDIVDIYDFSNTNNPMDIIKTMSPAGELFDSVLVSWEKSYLLFHDLRKSSEYFEELTKYIYSILIEEIPREFLLIADVANIDSDTSGDLVYYYFGDEGELSRLYHDDHYLHDVSISNIKKLLEDEYGKLSRAQLDNIKSFGMLDLGEVTMHDNLSDLLKLAERHMEEEEDI